MGAVLGLLRAKQTLLVAEGPDPPSFLLLPSLSLPCSSLSSVHMLRLTQKKSLS